MLKYKCLVLDHDDTVVMSSPQIHYPSFRISMKTLRPECNLSYEEFMNYCFDPGFYPLCTDILRLSEEEMRFQYDSWMHYVENHIPSFYPGIKELIQRQKACGGFVCVVSHSNAQNIRRDYASAGAAEPDLVFGWELGEGKRKPAPYPLQKIMEEFGLKPSDLLVIDDLKPGLEMAEQCRVDFACAGWSHDILKISEYMKQNSAYYFRKVPDLEHFLFEG